ncbi:hypothetical protein MKEN_00751400 [Mycena kentingensis (nom. inval.)]|nr:hypothetical protein MKEN_00751400 [Mycena kentingensis (nom. inval.)]
MASSSTSSSSTRSQSSSASMSGDRSPSRSSLTSPSFPSPSSSSSPPPPSGYPYPYPPPSPPPNACVNGSNSCPRATPATLYLYTFLSTLIVLLIVSGGIIARSVYLRRVQQRNGTWMPARAPRVALGLGRKPEMFDVYIAECGTGTGPKLTMSGMGRSARWLDMKPFAASERPLAAVTDPDANTRAQIPLETDVAFLIAMPFQTQEPPDPDADEEREFPYLEFGVVPCHVGADAGGREGVQQKQDGEAG